MPTIEFFYDYGSPFSFLANAALPALASDHAATLRYRPMLLGGVFKATGNQSPMMETVEAKRSYGGRVMQRTSQLLGVEIAMNSHFPINTIGVMRLAVAAQHEGVFDAFHGAIYPAFWQQGRDLGSPEVQAEVMREAGLEADALLALAGSDDVKAELRANTEEAVSRGAFGAPTCFVGDEMFFGCDHLPHLARQLEDEAR